MNALTDHSTDAEIVLNLGKTDPVYDGRVYESEGKTRGAKICALCGVQGGKNQENVRHEAWCPWFVAMKRKYAKGLSPVLEPTPPQPTKRELELEELLRSAHAIASRKGVGTAWERFAESIAKAGIGNITARTYRTLESDIEFSRDAARTALRDAIACFGNKPDILVTEERLEAWRLALDA